MEERERYFIGKKVQKWKKGEEMFGERERGRGRE